MIMINEGLLILILLLLLLNKWIRTVFVFNYMMHCKYIVIILLLLLLLPSNPRFLVCFSTLVFHLVCSCSETGAFSVKCNVLGVQCECKKGFAGTRCEHCNVGFYGYPNCKGTYT